MSRPSRTDTATVLPDEPPDPAVGGTTRSHVRPWTLEGYQSLNPPLLTQKHFNPEAPAYIGTITGIALIGFSLGIALDNIDFAFTSLGNNVSYYQCFLLSGITLTTLSTSLLHYLSCKKQYPLPALHAAIPTTFALSAPLIIGVGYGLTFCCSQHNIDLLMGGTGIVALLLSSGLAFLASYYEWPQSNGEHTAQTHTTATIIVRSCIFILANTAIGTMTPWAMHNTLLVSDPTMTSITILGTAALIPILILLVNDIADAVKPSKDYEPIYPV